MDLGFAGGENPDRAQALDVIRRDLVERAVAPAIVGAAYGEPVTLFGIFKALGGYRLVIAQHGRNWRGRLRLRLTKAYSRCHCQRDAKASDMEHGCLPLVHGFAIIHDTRLPQRARVSSSYNAL